MIFSMTKKIVVAVGILVFCSGQFDAFASKLILDDLDEQPRKPFVIATTDDSCPITNMIPDLMKSILAKANKDGADPRDLECVCKYWYNCMRYAGVAPTLDIENIPYTTKKNDYFMEDCMRRYREALVFGATLFYKKGQIGVERAILFSDFKDGTANLKDCEGEDGKQVYTYNRTRFLEVGGPNTDKLVTFIGPRHWVEDLLPPNACSSSIVILWKLGNVKLDAGFDFLTSCSVDEISSKNFFANWWGSAAAAAGAGGWAGRVGVWGGWRKMMETYHACFKPK